MLIHASTQSKRWKRGSDRKIAAELGVMCDIRDMCGSLHLDAEGNADLQLLTALYNQCFGRGENKGSITVKDHTGAVVLQYGYQKKAAEEGR